MKNLLLILLILPFTAPAQSRADYEKAMARFVRFYNNSQGDSIVNMFREQDRAGVKLLWKPDEMAKLHARYGNISSCKFLRIDNANHGFDMFGTVFTKIGRNGSGMLLKGGYVETFALLTEDPDAKSKKK